MINVHSEEYILGQNIRNCRMKKKWTQKQLAIAVDVDRADISRYENGTKGAMNFKKLKNFAEALDVTIDDLLDKENLKRGASIQKKYDQLNPVHQNIINETIDAYLCKERYDNKLKCHLALKAEWHFLFDKKVW